ncbi:hypothetical protein T07_13843 [Trichinella nelsoni]|uniref:Uncharacterized protein n=1 Tax=Trichinella nelsoni TaxID=6336 RepID=A0A0V0RQS4_9BILA|nr:hypothetical protein T07_13843 [Trichinella nelsoni]
MKDEGYAWGYASGNPRRRLRLCPRANKNLHIPAGYAEGILLHNICLQGDMQIFICFQAMPRAFPQVCFENLHNSAPGALLLQFDTYMFSSYFSYFSVLHSA